MATMLLKSQQEQAKEIVKQIFSLALEFNANCTKQSTTGNKPTVHVCFYGHVAGVQVSIDANGWEADNEEGNTEKFNIWLGDEFFTQFIDEYDPYAKIKECEQLTKAKAALSELKKIAEEWGVVNV